ncbi:hypothetical protein VP01_760g6 [Puccinia sorghi]|uniref:Uncharacterized protein n=1 Tax=Puccinia sorghi TaxID=27349 RepID=A0A0L6UBX9_9BASI|nr:hypothetical protein VP01_760g6 [Puccinia sorghi]
MNLQVIFLEKETKQSELNKRKKKVNQYTHCLFFYGQMVWINEFWKVCWGFVEYMSSISWDFWVARPGKQQAPKASSNLATPVAFEFGALGAKCGKAPGLSSPSGDAIKVPPIHCKNCTSCLLPVTSNLNPNESSINHTQIESTFQLTSQTFNSHIPIPQYLFFFLPFILYSSSHPLCLFSSVPISSVLSSFQSSFSFYPSLTHPSVFSSSILVFASNQSQITKILYTQPIKIVKTKRRTNDPDLPHLTPLVRFIQPSNSGSKSTIKYQQKLQEINEQLINTYRSPRNSEDDDYEGEKQVEEEVEQIEKSEPQDQGEDDRKIGFKKTKINFQERDGKNFWNPSKYFSNQQCIGTWVMYNYFNTSGTTPGFLNIFL